MNVPESRIEEAVAKIDAAPVEELRQLLLADKWVMCLTPREKAALPSEGEAEIRRYMKDMLCEDYAYVVEALNNFGIPVTMKECMEEDDEEPGEGD